MRIFDPESLKLIGPGGTIDVPPTDEVTRKLAMLYEGQCGGLGPSRAAKAFGFSRARYHQLLRLYQERGASALANAKRGPKRRYRRTHEVERQVIRHRFLDPDASAEVIAQKLQQCGFQISIRSVQRVVEDYGLQKKTVQIPPGPHRRRD